MSKILVYRDYGTSGTTAEHLFDWLESSLMPLGMKVQYTDATSIVELDALNQDVIAFVMPGGHSRFFSEKLNKTGNQKIREFVSKGGIYIGVCGGAYYACQEIDFTGAELRFQRKGSDLELGFFEGVSVGSLPEVTQGQLYDETAKTAAAVRLDFADSQACQAYYHGGCKFVLYPTADKNCYMVLARYMDVDNGQAIAAIACQVGLGRAILCGVHPEMCAKSLEDGMTIRYEYYEVVSQIASQLRPSHQDLLAFRQYLLAAVVGRAQERAA